jgi:GNAT superfamily N-acetyltransferase
MSIIRQATENDLPALLRLLEAKAEFDGCRSSLRATVQSLRRELFRPDPPFRAIVAVESDVPVGMATYFTTFSSFLMKPGLWMDDLYVDAEHRGEGIGSKLITWLCKLAIERGCGRLEWVVAAGNSRGRKFYADMGASVSGTSYPGRLDEEAMRMLVMTDG